MNAFVAPEIDWLALLPILIVVGAGVIGVFVAAFAPASSRRTIQVVLTLGATLATLVVLGWRWATVVGGGEGTLVAGQLAEDGPALAGQLIIALIALVGFCVIASRMPDGEDAFAPQGAAAPGSAYEEAARKAGRATAKDSDAAPARHPPRLPLQPAALRPRRRHRDELPRRVGARAL